MKERNMNETQNISRPIIEGLYCEALVLADEVREAFDLCRQNRENALSEYKRMAISVEGLRTTTRMMHILAWLLNQRAFFEGELSEFQLRRHSKLPEDRRSDPENMQILASETQILIAQTEKLHERITRLDSGWRAGLDNQMIGVRQLQQRLSLSLRHG